ncbi:MAG TPA: hypothetical protein PK040_00440 [Anaerolineaceae bacterium]|nr:hypothetical protein [Anaerolineaceae bacterium]
MEPIKALALMIASVIAFLIVVVEHYLPWQLILRKELPKIPAYILGVLAFGIPLSVLFTVITDWTSSEIVLSFWVVVISAGAGTVGCYNLDSLIHNRARADESEEREQKLLDLNRNAK